MRASWGGVSSTTLTSGSGLGRAPAPSHLVSMALSSSCGDSSHVHANRVCPRRVSCSSRADELRCRVSATYSAHRVRSHMEEAIMATKAIPEGYHSVTPYLDHQRRGQSHRVLQIGVRRHRADAHGTSRTGRSAMQKIKIGDSAVMLADEAPEMGYRSPQSLGGAGVSLMVYVDRVDDVFKRAIATGAKELQSGQGSVLRRSIRHVAGSVRAHVDDCNSRRRHSAGRAAAARASKLPLKLANA